MNTVPTGSGSGSATLLKGTASRDFFAVFFIKQRLLVQLDKLGKDFEFFRIFEGFLVFLVVPCDKYTWESLLSSLFVARKFFVNLF
jgi:hypothetical protein